MLRYSYDTSCVDEKVRGASVASGTSCLQVFDGNVDSYSVKHYYLDDAVLARYVKFHTVQWHRHPSMRVEIIGCQGRFITSPQTVSLYVCVV